MGPIEITVIVITSIVVVGIIFSLIRNKKKGKTSCGCDCGCCPHSAICHQDAKKDEDKKSDN